MHGKLRDSPAVREWRTTTCWLSWRCAWILLKQDASIFCGADTSSFASFQTEAPADFYFTSIAEDNLHGRKFLERGLAGMPQYEFIGEFVTVLLSAVRGTSARPQQESDVSFTDEIIDRLNEHNRFCNSPPNWSTDDLTALERLGLQSNNFHFIRERGRIVAGAAIWDQRTFKQTVVRGYGSSLASLRPMFNLGAYFWLATSARHRHNIGKRSRFASNLQRG